MRVCDGCGIRMPAWKPRQRNADGDLLCEGCTNGRPGRPVGHHGLREVSLVCESCSTPMGELGLVVTAGKMVCPEGCKTAAVPDDECGETDPPSNPSGPRCTLSLLHDGPHRSADGHTWAQQGEQHEAGLQVVAHDSGDGATIYHCPFCGAGQVTARSDGTVECGFCHTYFTVQVQPQHSAQPQTINGQPVQMPGMPGDPTHADSAQQPQPQQVEDPNFAPAGSGGAAGPTGEGGFAPAGSAGKQFLPAGSGGTHTRAASKVAYEAGDERHDPQEGDEPCTCCDGSGEHPSGHECYRCDSTGLEKNAAGECDAETMAKGARKTAGGEVEVLYPGCYAIRLPRRDDAITPGTCPTCHQPYGYAALAKRVTDGAIIHTYDCRPGKDAALYLTPDQVAIPEPAYLAHLALRFADDRDAVLTAVRNERTAR